MANTGRPDSSETTSASCQARFPGAPSALAIASLAANLAARDASGRISLLRGEEPIEQPGCARQGVPEPVDVDHVDADADDRHSEIAAPTRP
ncbi:MAG: hypothetical protein V9F00_10340 [Nocardioides sp.]